MGNDITARSKKFGIVVVTYHPPRSTIEYISQLKTDDAEIYIIDNSEEPIDFSLLDDTDDIHVTRYGENLGLAHALNDGIEKAAADNIQNIFLFDQDTRIDDDFFNEMLSFKERNNTESYCVYAPNFIDINSNTYAKFSVLNRFRWHTVQCDQASSLITTFAITSGSLIDYKTYKKLDGFDSRYFIDHIDSEYCIRAARSGYKVIINCNALLQHSIGERTVHRFLGLTIKPNHHNASRRYYIARNGMHMTMKHGMRYPSLLTLHAARIAHEILSVVLYEDQKIKKMLAMVIGTLHGTVGKLGKCRSTSISK